MYRKAVPADRGMLDPKTPLQAAAIFIAGLGIISYTILDINRTTRLNERPLTDEQKQRLAAHVQSAQGIVPRGNELQELSKSVR